MAGNYYNNPYTTFGVFDQEDETNLAGGIGTSNMGNNYTWSKDNTGLANRYANLADQWNTRYGLAGSNALTANQVKDVDDAGGLGGITETLSQGKPENDLTSWFGNKGNQAMIGAGLGVGQLGLGLASYLQQSDFMKKQGKLLDQQLASNQYNIDRQKSSDEANRRSYEAAEARRSGMQPTATA